MRPPPVLSLLMGFSALAAGAAIEPGVYQTLPGATMEERGDRVPNERRILPISATFTFDWDATPLSLAATMPNAVLEGGAPFALTVHSASGTQLGDGTYGFTGDYLRDLHPSGTQYGFDWRFSKSANGTLTWNGQAGWYGGHAWYVTISNLTLVPVPKLEVTPAAGSQLIVSWPANYSGYVLEMSASLSATNWVAVTNAVSIAGDRYATSVPIDAGPAFFRLRK